MKSPRHALLWEVWRVTRVEAAWKLAVGIAGGMAVLLLCATFAPADNASRYEDVMELGAAAAMILLVLPHMWGWQSMAKLIGGKPGFPLHLLYTRPVRTAVVVVLPMAYLTAASLAIYLVSALLMRVTWGYAFPLLPVAAWIAALTLVFVTATWSTRNRTMEVAVMTLTVVQAFRLAMDRLTAVEIPDTYDWPPRLWPTLFDFPHTDYAVIALIGIAAFGVTVAGVSRQRRGEGWAEVPPAQRGGLWGWLVNLFRLPCPTSSATRAQLWFDLKSNGLPLLTIGVTLAIVILLVSAVSNPIDVAINAKPGASCPIAECYYARAFPPLLAPLSLLLMLFLGANAFGIHRRQGRTYLSAFEATQARSTAQLAALKLLVKSACVFAALIAIGASVWISLPLLGDAVFIQMWEVPLNSRLSVVKEDVAALPAYQLLALVFVVAGGVLIWVTAFAVLGALWTRYSRRMNIAAASLLLGGLALALLALAGQDGTLPTFLVDALFVATRWIAGAALVFTTVYFFWRAFAEHLLSMRYVCGALLISAAFAAAWLTVLHLADARIAVATLWPLVLALMASVVAPWSLHRLRHL